MTRRTRILRATAVGAVALLLLASCAAGANDLAGVPTDAHAPYGFWWGLWHGLIAPITFVVSLFSDTVGIYETHNVGAWYDFGFLAGLSFVFGSGPGTRAARKRAPRRG